MFDDLKDQNNNQDTTRDAVSQSPPSSLPVTPDNNADISSQKSKDPVVVEDMLADSPEDSLAGETTPAMPSMSYSSSDGKVETPTNTPPATPPTMTGVPNMPDDPMSWPDNSASVAGKKKMLIAGIVVVVVILLGIGGYVAYQRFVVQQPVAPINESENINNDTDTTTKPTNNDTGTTPVTEDVISDTEDSATDLGLPIDSDGDGLTDQEELKYNTDPDLADTDRDGLFDREEVVSWKTDPLNPDSDGDSFLDGDEVKNGYDPLGPGKLEFFDQLNF